MTSEPLVFRKSSYSSPDAQCVEVAKAPGAVAVRDSKNPEGGMLTLSVAEFGALLDRLR